MVSYEIRRYKYRENVRTETFVRSHPHTPWGEEPQRLPFRVGQSRAQTRRPTHLSPPAERMRGVRSATGRIFELVPTLVHRDDGPPVPVASASEQARLGDARRGCGLAARCLHGTAPPEVARQAVAAAAPVPERVEPALYSLVPATIDRPVAALQAASRPRFDQHPAAERTGVQEGPSSTLVRRRARRISSAFTRRSGACLASSWTRRSARISCALTSSMR